MQPLFLKRTCQYVLYMLIPLVCACLFFCTIYARQEIRALNKQGENSLEALYSQLDLVVDSIMEQENGVANNAHMTVALKKILSMTTTFLTAMRFPSAVSTCFWTAWFRPMSIFLLFICILTDTDLIFSPEKM